MPIKHGYFNNCYDIDVDECATEHTHNCNMDDRHKCNNTIGSFICVCKSGYRGDNCESKA